MGPVTLQTYEKEMELGIEEEKIPHSVESCSRSTGGGTCPACPRHLKLALLQLLPQTTGDWKPEDNRLAENQVAVTAVTLLLATIFIW